jgi:death-on-curing protein
MTPSPVFLSLEETLAIHRDQVERYGGTDGIRDMALLQSALAMPSSGMGGDYFHADLFEMAAAYVFHIVRNHPFVDGNKRVGAMAAYVFLGLNGMELTASEEAYEELVLGVAEGRTPKSAVALFFRRHARPSRRR